LQPLLLGLLATLPLRAPRLPAILQLASIFYYSFFNPPKINIEFLCLRLRSFEFLGSNSRKIPIVFTH
jgi:hypothetical protein